MGYDIPKCDQAGCTGHLGKFQDCRAEAAYELSMDGGDGTTGATEYNGHYTLLILDAPEDVDLYDGPTVTVPAGAYIVQATNSGAVYLLTYGSEDDARKDFDAAAADYAEWDDAEV